MKYWAAPKGGAAPVKVVLSRYVFPDSWCRDWKYLNKADGIA